MPSASRFLQRIDSHHRVITAFSVAVLAGVCLIGRMRIPALVITSWNVFSVTSISMAWAHILFVSDPTDCIKSAKLQDSSRSWIFFFVLASACASLFAIAYLILTRNSQTHGSVMENAFLAIGTVVSSWTLIHTIFALRYAHIFYGHDEHVRQKGEKTALQFPEETDPDYLDFAYFSFVIGMTCQVSDVQICSRRVRRLALLHGLLSFLFNTVIVAMSINTISGLF